MGGRLFGHGRLIGIIRYRCINHKNNRSSLKVSGVARGEQRGNCSPNIGQLLVNKTNITE